MEKVFDNHVLEILVDTELNCIFMNWKPVLMKSEEYRAGLEQGLKVVTSRGLANWIANLQEMKLIKLEDEKWTNENWFPRALKSPIRKMAVILSKDVFNKVAVTNIMNQKQVKLSIESQYFSNTSDAENWIRSFFTAKAI